MVSASHTTESKFTRNGIEPTGSRLKRCPSIVKSGYPGAWATPRVTAAIINSGESPTTMSRAAVRKYKIPAAVATATAPIHVLELSPAKIDIGLTTNEHKQN